MHPRRHVPSERCFRPCLRYNPPTQCESFEQLLLLEEMFRRSDGMAENQVPEDIRCAILVACCPKDLKEYLDMSSDDLVSSDLRVKANTWIERKRDQQPKNLQQLVSKNHQGPTPVEIGAAQWGQEEWDDHASQDSQDWGGYPDASHQSCRWHENQLSEEMSFVHQGGKNKGEGKGKDGGKGKGKDGGKGGNHPVICWLIEHSADLLNKYQKGDDGRTAYHRLRGKSWNHKMVAFGEKVHYRINRKALTQEYKLDGRWGEGYFMGVKWRTGGSWIATGGGMCKASAIRRVGGHRRWDAEGLLQVKGVPWDHVQKDADPGEVRIRWLDPSLLPTPVVAEDDGPKRRRARLNKEDLYKFGFTDRCLGCQAIIQGGETRPHTEHCRARLENEMRNTAEGQVRLQKAKERLDTEMVEKLKKLTDKAQGGSAFQTSKKRSTM